MTGFEWVGSRVVGGVAGQREGERETAGLTCELIGQLKRYYRRNSDHDWRHVMESQQ